MNELIVIIICALAYAVKGGWHGQIRRAVARKAGIQFDDKNEPFDMSIAQAALWRVTDGKIVSALMFSTMILIDTSGGLLAFAVAGAGWLLCVSPKIGRPIGKVGGILGNWDENEVSYGKDVRRKMAIEGLKEGAIRFAFGGAMLTLFLSSIAAPNVGFIIAGLMTPLVYWFGVSIQQLRTARTVADWHLAEPMVGLAFAIAYLTGG